MADYTRIRRQQLLREAEGYLELIGLFGDQWSLPTPVRDRLAQRALDTLERVPPTSGNRPQVLLLTGQAYRAMGRYAEAVEPLKAASELDSDNLSVWLALGWCYKRLGRIDLAIESLDQALSVDEDAAIVHYNLACYWALTRNVPMSVLYLSQAFELDPGYRERVAAESDFDLVRNDPHFQALVASVIV